MNKNGFTLVEVITVIVLLGLVVGLAVPGVLRGSRSAKERTLNAKIENIEKAAVLYGQKNRNLISKLITNTEDKDLFEYCFKEDGSLINNCYYYLDEGETVITVGFLANPDGDDSTDDGYIEYDDEVNKLIKNSIDESKNINDCEIQIYQKYGKIYAVYNKELESNGSRKCWVV